MAGPEPEGHPPPFPGLLMVLSGPSGVGKDAVLTRLRDLGRPYHMVVTATTRPIRPSEQDGIHYLFLSETEFRRMVEAGEFLEWALVYGHYYGVPKAQVRQAMERGQDVIVKADVQGAATIKGIAPQAVLVFLAPPSMEALERHLHDRKTEGQVDLRRRLGTAHEEMERLPDFDYMVVNRDGALDETVARVEAILTAERCRYPARVVEL